MTQRRTLSVLTMTVLVTLLVLGAFLGWRALSAPLPGDDEPEADAGPRCKAGLAEGEIVRTRDITVSVYNAGTRSGLAGQTLDQLAGRGFLPGDISNAPTEYGDVRFARVLATSPNDPAARLVALQFGPNTAVQVAPDLGPGVEVLVGDDLGGLTEAAPRRLRAAAAGSGC
jgi:hypothetical protein